MLTRGAAQESFNSTGLRPMEGLLLLLRGGAIAGWGLPKPRFETQARLKMEG